MWYKKFYKIKTIQNFTKQKNQCINCRSKQIANEAAYANILKLSLEASIQCRILHILFEILHPLHIVQKEHNRYLFSKLYQDSGSWPQQPLYWNKMSSYNSGKSCTIQDTLYWVQTVRKTLKIPKLLKTSQHQIGKDNIHTLTIPATNAPQLKVPISFGIDINLKMSQLNTLVYAWHESWMKDAKRLLDCYYLFTRSSFSLIIYSSSCSVPFSSESATLN